MKPYTFFIKTNDPSKAILLAKQEVEKQNGTLAYGHFEVKGFKGYYMQAVDGVGIILNKKPFWAIAIDDETVESKIREYFSTMGA